MKISEIYSYKIFGIFFIFIKLKCIIFDLDISSYRHCFFTLIIYTTNFKNIIFTLVMYNWDKKSHIYIGYMDNWCKKVKFTSIIYETNEKSYQCWIHPSFCLSKKWLISIEMKNVPNFVAEISFEHFYIYKDKKHKMC